MSSVLAGRMYFNQLYLLAVVNVAFPLFEPRVLYASNVDGEEGPECTRWIAQHPLRATGWGIRAASLAGVRPEASAVGLLQSPESSVISMIPSTFNCFLIQLKFHPLQYG